MSDQTNESALFQAARDGDVETLETLPDARPDTLTIGMKPYGMTRQPAGPVAMMMHIAPLLIFSSAAARTITSSRPSPSISPAKFARSSAAIHARSTSA